MAANLLKPALARGELRPSRTTWSEYKQYFEKGTLPWRGASASQLATSQHQRGPLTILRGLAPVYRKAMASTCAMIAVSPPPNYRARYRPPGNCDKAVDVAGPLPAPGLRISRAAAPDGTGTLAHRAGGRSAPATSAASANQQPGFGI